MDPEYGGIERRERLFTRTAPEIEFADTIPTIR
jgi:hypothetical protein